MARLRIVPLLVATLLAVGGAARAERPDRRAPRVPAFTTTERQALLAGATVSRPMHFKRGADGSYIGGVAYQVVNASP